MLPFIAEHVEKLWGTWNIRGLIILSLLLQSFLILFAPLRRQKGGKWVVMISIWSAYLLADWLATFTIGLMLRAERSDILALWAPFLLLHLGGPDTITSFSLGDNDFWIRHLIGLMLQVYWTVYVFFQSLPQNKLWLPTLLVLTAGIIKYAERNCAFYLASLDHFGNNWACLPVDIKMPPIPVQFSYPNLYRLSGRWSIIPKAACTVGTIKSLLVGPPMTRPQQLYWAYLMEETDSHEMLRTIEIQLSILYELLHSKLPVIDSKIGYVCRIVNFGCILGALLSFSILLKKYYHNKLGEFDIYLTYGLLIGALALDLISIWLLMSSDWIIIRQYSEKKNYDEFINKHRWSNSVPQLNIFACRFKNKDGELVDFLGIRSLFEMIRRILCVSHKKFGEGQVWKFVFTTLRKIADQIHFGRGMFRPARTNFDWTLDKFDNMESLLIWHIATEICYQKELQDNSLSSSASTSNNSFNHREICKLLSDYMFYLLVMEPTMTATSPNNLKVVFEGAKTWKWPFTIRGEKGSKETFVKDLEKLLEKEDENAYINLDLLKEDVDKLGDERNIIAGFSRIAAARCLAKELLNQPGGCPWKVMGKFWVEIVCNAANNCQPIVHARQVSRGGHLLTLVWLLINYLGLTYPSKDWYDVLDRTEPAAD